MRRRSGSTASATASGTAAGTWWWSSGCGSARGGSGCGRPSASWDTRPLDETTWISPRPSRELEALLEAERVRAERFVASYDGDARGLVARAWDLDGLSHAYQGWLAVAADLVAPAGPGAPDEVVFAVRSRLVHEWRKFLFRDPGLPAELLPGQWAGRQAAEVFDVESARLLPAASRFVDCCLRPGGAHPAPAPDRRG